MEELNRKMDFLMRDRDAMLKEREEDKKMIKLLEGNLKNVKTQLGQMAQEKHFRPHGALPSDTIAAQKGKEQCHAITLRNGKELSDQPIELPSCKKEKKNSGVSQAEPELESENDDMIVEEQVQKDEEMKPTEEKSSQEQGETSTAAPK